MAIWLSKVGEYEIDEAIIEEIPEKAQAAIEATTIINLDDIERPL